MAADTAGETVARRGRLTHTALSGWAIVIYLFLFTPIILLILLSFNSNPAGTLPIKGWTLHWFSDVANDSQVQDAVKTTLQVALEVTLISTVVGTAAAFPLVRRRLRFRTGLRTAFMLPIMIPGLLIGVSLLSFFTNVLGIQLSTQTAVIGQAVYTTPFVLLIVAARLQGFDQTLEQAASDLGADAFRRFRHVVLPLIGPAVFAGALFAFTLSLDEFVITLFLVGGQVTLPIYIYTQLKFGITPAINAVATMLIVASLGLSAVGFMVPRLVRKSVRRVRSRRVKRLSPAPPLASGRA
jgi:ABC-type spermidine/putrescine transport system permease subunit II